MEKYFKDLVIKDNIKGVKLDIGLSFNAPSSKVWLEQDPNIMVIGFEPNPDFLISVQSDGIDLRGIVSHQHNNGSLRGTIIDEYINKRFFIFPIALFDVNEPTEMPFYQTENDTGCSSIHKPTSEKFVDYKLKANVPVYSLKHFFDLFPFDKFEYIEYIKIDAQGSDLDILISAGDYLKEKVVYITAEPECIDYENVSHNNEKNMEEYLISQNFERIYNTNARDPTFINKKFIDLKDKIFIWQQT